ncbi:uncharacterized protein K452DRAFT_285491 [Aplosporella prunicola CBS 121167]|uniref:Uncharacterized protein n=1 Tax=Aplosporella prunicola CBS 121167 TaxID=1176127 RepID=A0A6A6BN40_9PEZI|nr:uncharacterized protein K452DRAFT_285491 [Aplosporella prunicola CBS 121167]KAF2144247.1 hypothetical protein K452DRAFT_285491 [Aplosporella prunicola CBS 121167]
MPGQTSSRQLSDSADDHTDPKDHPPVESRDDVSTDSSHPEFPEKGCQRPHPPVSVRKKNAPHEPPHVRAQTLNAQKQPHVSTRPPDPRKRGRFPRSHLV